jgi:hypothetical protein
MDSLMNGSVFFQFDQLIFFFFFYATTSTQVGFFQSHRRDEIFGNNAYQTMGLLLTAIYILTDVRTACVLNMN